ncbi:uncharacterized protein LOC127737439 [Mytilus californianus]|uniref:uncharacterized protein LOC127737439 n=1 Tax=Mytilus californianus TaxID=6549 RepID=UPI002245DA90|nr:uncharacterized protein LOC127737439 [Mytilus californianus]
MVITVQLIAFLYLTFTSVNGHGNSNYNNGNRPSLIRPQVSQRLHTSHVQETANVYNIDRMAERVNIHDNFDSTVPAVTSRFASGFTSQQIIPNVLPGGLYAGSSNNNDARLSSTLGAWNSYGQRVKRFALPNVSVIQKSNQIEAALAENQHLRTTLHGLDNGIHNANVVGSLVNKHKSKIGKGLAKNERLAKVLNDIQNGGDTLVVHGEVLDIHNHPIGKALSKNGRLSKRLDDIHNDNHSLLVQGSKRKTIKEIRKSNTALKNLIVKSKKQRRKSKAMTKKQIKQENAKVRKQIFHARRQKNQQTPIIIDNTNTVSIQQSSRQQQNYVPSSFVIDQSHPIGLTLADNRNLQTQLHIPNPNINGPVTFVDKYSSNIGKGLAENERLTKLLNDIQYGGDTLVVHGEALEMRKHKIGKGLTKNDRLNKMLYDIQNEKDSIVIQGSKRKLMKEIRKANALLRKRIDKAKQQHKNKKTKTLREIRKDNASLKRTIQRNQRKRL